MKQKISLFLLELNISQRLYLFSIIALILFFLFASSIREFAYLSLFFAVAAIAKDALDLYIKAWKSVLGKGIILLIWVLVTNFSLALSSQIINNIVKVEPTQLIYTLSFASVINIPIIIGILSIPLYFGLLILSLFMMFFMFFKKELLDFGVYKKIEKYPVLSGFVRFVVAIFLSGLLVKLSSLAIPKYEKFASDITSAFIYEMEAYKHSRCILEKDQKSILINSQEIIVVDKTSDGYSFNLRLCKAKVKENLVNPNE